MAAKEQTMRKFSGRWRWPVAGGVVVGALAATTLVLVLEPRTAIIKGPYLQNVQPDRVTIMWETDREGAGVVEYGLTPAFGRRAAETGRSRVHEVTLDGLSPRTEYHYRVRTQRAQSDPAAFTTAFLGDDPFTFAVYGDTRSNPPVHEEVARLVASWRPAFVLHTGDLVAAGTMYELWALEFFTPAAALLRSACLWPVLGNHEYDAEHYYRFFSLPLPERHYTFRWGNARFIALDSNDGLVEGTRQLVWLRAVLEQPAPLWTIVFFHHPVYSHRQGGGLVRNHVVPLLERHGVDLAFVGHNHYYERTVPVTDGERDDERGVVYVTTGGGGAPLHEPVWSDLTAAGYEGYHACLVRVDGTRLTVEARGLADEVQDTLELRKAGGRRVAAGATSRAAWPAASSPPAP